MPSFSGVIVEFTLTEVEINRKFVNRAKLMLTTLYFARFYVLTGDKEETFSVWRSVMMTGLFGFVLGCKIKKRSGESFSTGVSLNKN